MFLAADGGDTGGRGPSDDFWYEPIGRKGAVGLRMDDDTAMRLAVLYACVNIISQDLAKVPLMMFRRKDDGGRERVQDHPIIKLLYAPARHMTGIDWKQRLEAHQLLRGNAYCEIRSNSRGRITELYPWRPSNVRTEVMRDESIRYHVRDPATGYEKPYLEGEVMHLRGLSIDGPLGLSPIDQLRDTLGEASAAQNYGATFFANDARPGIVLKHPSHFKDEGQRKDWLTAFKRAFGGSGRGAPMLTEYGIEIEQLEQVSHVDLQFIELRKMKGVEICAMYRMPPHKVAILDRSTNNNIEHQGIEYVTDCLLTWCRRWEERLAADLLTDSEREEYYFEFMLDALMRGDAKSRNEAYQSAVVGAGWMTRNEVRRRENLDVLPDLDEPLEPLNTVPAGKNPSLLENQPVQPPPANDAPDDAQDARSRSLELQARRRVLNRETRAIAREWERSAGSQAAFADGVTTFYATHLPFVMEALVVSRARAQLYCESQCNVITAAVEKDQVPKLLAQWELAAGALVFSALPSDEDLRAEAEKERAAAEAKRHADLLASDDKVIAAIGARPPATTTVNVSELKPADVKVAVAAPVVHVGGTAVTFEEDRRTATTTYERDPETKEIVRSITTKE